MERRRIAMAGRRGKGWIALAACAVLACLLAGAVFGQSASEYPSITVTSTKYEPYPAEPGAYLDVWVKLENQGLQDARDVVLEFVPSYPFQEIEGETYSYDLGSLSYGVDVVKKFTVLVDPRAVEGTNKFKVRYSVDGGPWVEKSLGIEVRRSEAILWIRRVSTSPGYIPPGGTGRVFITIENTADSLARDVTVSLDLSRGDLPFAHIGGVAEKRQKYLNGGDTATISFDILVDPEAEPGVYKVPVTLEYTNVGGATYSLSDIVSIIVSGEPELDVRIENENPLVAGTPGELQVKIVNRGLIPVKLLNVKVLPGEGYEILPPAEDYIGNLDSDDYETSTFRIHITSSGGTISVPVVLEYKDALNKDYNETRRLEVRVFTPEELSRYGYSTERSYAWPVLLVVIAGGVVLWWLRRERE